MQTITTVNAPRPGERWTHYSGRVYTVVSLANEHTQDHVKYPIHVVHRGENGRIWTRPLSDWSRSFTFKDSLLTRHRASAGETLAVWIIVLGAVIGACVIGYDVFRNVKALF